MPEIDIAPSPSSLKRNLNAKDVSFLLLAAVFNINVVPIVAANGAVTIWLYLLAFAVFLLPEGVAVLELSYRYPQEGGVYVWAKQSFGEFHGFLCGWCYWTNNMLYLPSVLLYLAGVSVYALGQNHAGLTEKKPVVLAIVLCATLILLLLNIVGSSIGKWISNIGAVGSLISAGVLLSVGVAFCVANGTSLHISDLRIPQDSALISNSFGVIVFALTGLELASVMGDEIRDPRRTLPISVGAGAIMCGLLYIACDFVSLVSLGQKRINLLQGLMQSIAEMTNRLGIEWAVPFFAAVLSVSILGTISAWLAGSARVPFVAGLDHYLPPWLGKIHPRYGTPYTALLLMGAVSVGFATMNVVSSGAQEAFQKLLAMAIVLQLIPFAYMFAALLKIAFSKDPGKGKYGKKLLAIAGSLGLLTTCFGLIFMLIPPRSASSAWSYETWMIFGITSFIGAAALLYFYFRLHASAQR